MLVTTGEILDEACGGRYAVAAANVGNSLDVCAAIEAAEELRSPVILDILQENMTPCAAGYIAWVRAVCDRARIPAAVNIDDDKSLSGAINAIRLGASGIMCHRKELAPGDNIAEVNAVTAKTEPLKISVEAAAGAFCMDGTASPDGMTTAEYAGMLKRETRAACIAVFARDNSGRLDISRIAAIKNAVGNYPLVLHGTLGLTEGEIASACRVGINKVNFSKELKAASLECVINNAGSAIASTSLKEGFRSKLMQMISICGSAGKA